jgi:1-acyl-sn-glycerol-3-phosphate acyltransferase
MNWLLDRLALLRSLFFTLPLLYLVTLVLGVVMEAVAWFDSTGERQYRLVRFWSRLLLAVSGLRLRIQGRENLEPGQHYVFVANHQSYYDIPVLFVGLPARVRFMAKASLFPIPFVGWYMRRAGHIPIDLRARSVQGNARQLLQAVRLIRQGHALVVFPEGGRSAPGEVDEFKSGIFLAASKAGVPVVPVTIAGTDRVLPRNSWSIRPGRVLISFGRPVRTEGMTRDQVDNLAIEMRQTIERNLREVSR